MFFTSLTSGMQLQFITLSDGKMAFYGPVIAVAFLKIAIFFSRKNQVVSQVFSPASGYYLHPSVTCDVVTSLVFTCDCLLTVLPYTQKIAYLAWFTIFILRVTKKRFLSPYYFCSLKKQKKKSSSHIIHALRSEYCSILRDSEPIRLLKSPRSLNVYILINNIFNIYVYIFVVL